MLNELLRWVRSEMGGLFVKCSCSRKGWVGEKRRRQKGESNPRPFWGLFSLGTGRFPETIQLGTVGGRMTEAGYRATVPYRVVGRILLASCAVPHARRST